MALPAVCLLSLLNIDRMSNDSDRVAGMRAQINVFLTALDAYPTTAQGLAALRVNVGIKGWQAPYWQMDVCLNPWKRN